jgi:hypothetical protein
MANDHASDQPLARMQVSRRGLMIGAATTVALGAVVPTLSATPADAATYTGKPIPWGPYANGDVPQSAMAAVGGVYLQPDAAAQMVKLRDAYQKRWNTELRITEGYRPMALQISYWNAYQNGTGNLAAYPGTSNHGAGLAVDFSSPITNSRSEQHLWLRTAALEFNWWWAGAGFSQVEPWHWEFKWPYAGQPTTPIAPPVTTPEEIEEMTASKDASIVRDYVTENTTGVVRTALIYPNGTAVALSAFDDVDSAVLAHAIVYGLAPTNDALSSPRDRYGAQVTSAQWAAFWAHYPGTKVGSFA